MNLLVYVEYVRASGSEKEATDMLGLEVNF